MPASARPAWLVAGMGLLLLCLAFTPEIGAAVRVWNQSTAYGHCWLVLPIVGWLLWERRTAVASGMPRPTMWPALAAVPVVLVWVAADWLGIMEGRQLALIAFAELLLVATLGWRLWWALSPAFLYLLFLVPFGAFLTPALQHFTTSFILFGLRVLDIPFDSDAFQITIPEGTFYVAEACAGLRFLIASVAFGVLYAVTIFRSPVRRAVFIAVSCVVPVVANGFRGLGIVVLGHVLGSAEAGAADHLIYGWVFFSIVIVMLALAGLPFREDFNDLPALPPAETATWRPLGIVSSVSVLLLAVAGPVVLGWIDRPALAQVVAAMPKISVPANCHAGDPVVQGAVSRQVFSCDDTVLQIAATTLPPRTNPSRIFATGRDAAASRMVGEVDSQTWLTPSGAAWVILRTHEPEREAAYTTIVSGRHLAGGLKDRIWLVRAMIQPAPPSAESVALTVLSYGHDADAQLRAFLAAFG